MLYSIKAVCALFDLPADTLRKWERRYPSLRPRRGGNSYRGYADEDLLRLEAFMRARKEGLPGPAAARRAQEAGGKAAAQVLRDAELEAAGEAAVRRLDRAEFLRVCARAEAVHGLGEAFAKVWIPLLSRLGESAIREQGLAIAKEHFAVAILRERLIKLEGSGRRPQLALASPEGELHEIGMLALAQELERRKLGYLYLGANLPTPSLCAALKLAKVKRVVVCLSRELKRPALKAMVASLRRKVPGVKVYLGGPASLAHANLISELGGVFLGSHLRLGVDKLLRGL